MALYRMDDFERDEEQVEYEQKSCAHGDAFEDFRYERTLIRNTFMNRFECDPEPSPYDFNYKFHARATAPSNYYEGQETPWKGSVQVNNLPVARNFGTGQFKIKESFEVKSGVTTGASLEMPKERFRPVKEQKVVGADILLNGGDPVDALQGGLVVYSSKKPDASERIDLNGHIVPVGDLSRLSGDVVIVQSWDEKSKGVRYHIYSGLDSATVIAGDRIKAGQHLGKAESTGLHYEVHRHTVQGPAVPIKLKAKGA